MLTTTTAKRKRPKNPLTQGLLVQHGQDLLDVCLFLLLLLLAGFWVVVVVVVVVVLVIRSGSGGRADEGRYPTGRVAHLLVIFQVPGTILAGILTRDPPVKTPPAMHP